MARIELHNGVTIKGARRILTRSGSSFRLTIRYGRVYTFRKFHCQQPNSPAQLKCRSLLVEATRLAKTDIARPGRLSYWTQRAASSGYKTAIGCARAHFVARLKASSVKADKSPSCSSRPIAVPVAARPAPSSPVSPSPSSDVIHIWRSADFLRFSSPNRRRKVKTLHTP